MLCKATLSQRCALLLPLLIVGLLASCALSCGDSSYSVRGEKSCTEDAHCPSSRVLNHSVRGGVTDECVYRRERLPRPTVWLLVAMLSALGGAALCWVANILAPTPTYCWKVSVLRGTCRQHSSIRNLQTRKKAID